MDAATEPEKRTRSLPACPRPGPTEETESHFFPRSVLSAELKIPLEFPVQLGSNYTSDNVI